MEYKDLLFSETNQQAIRQHNLREGLRQEVLNNKQVQQRARELEEANEALLRVSAQRSEILRIVSHDIRNPLGAIIGLAHEISEEHSIDSGKQADAETYEMAVMIEESGQRLLSLVEQLIVVSQMETEQVELEPTDTNVRTMAELAIRLIRPVAAHKQIALTLEMSATALLLRLDEAKMSHVLGNLLSNAIKFTPKGGTVVVRVSYDRAAQAVQIDVEDTGIGIPKEHLERLFERTHDIRRPGTNREQGSGLGLSIVKHFVELHNGELTIVSKEGEGTRIRIRVPAEQTTV